VRTGRGVTVRTARSFSRIQSIRQIVFVPLGVRVGSQNISQFSFDGARTLTASASVCNLFFFSNIVFTATAAAQSILTEHKGALHRARTRVFATHCLL
jgi:hypothetical protein